ncbi:cell division protein ZapB [bacterium]|nr:cell division protein ZapB [bacterium]
MENQIFDTLEEKIDQILDYFSRLTRENRELREKLVAMEKQIGEQERTIQALGQMTEKNQGMENEIETYRQKQEKVRKKIDTLLNKLKEFEHFE